MSEVRRIEDQLRRAFEGQAWHGDSLMELLSGVAANQAAAKKKMTRAYWALAQYDFAYNPARVRRAIAEDPLFLGVFDWNDSEDEEGRT